MSHDKWLEWYLSAENTRRKGLKRIVCFSRYSPDDVTAFIFKKPDENDWTTLCLPMNITTDKKEFKDVDVIEEES